VSVAREKLRGGKERSEERRRTRTSSPSGPTDVDVVLVHVGNGVLEHIIASERKQERKRSERCLVERRREGRGKRQRLTQWCLSLQILRQRPMERFRFEVSAKFLESQ